MGDEKAKYLIVKASEITKQLYKHERIFSYNDFHNIYCRVGKKDANEAFEKNGVPEEFRKFFIKVSGNLLTGKNIEELTTGYPFVNRTRRGNKTRVVMANSPIHYCDGIFEDKYVFSTDAQYTSFNNVMYYLDEIHKAGYIEQYMQSIRDFLGMSFDWDLLFESWNQTHDKEKALELFKHKMASQKGCD